MQSVATQNALNPQNDADLADSTYYAAELKELREEETRLNKIKVSKKHDEWDRAFKKRKETLINQIRNDIRFKN